MSMTDDGGDSGDGGGGDTGRVPDAGPSGGDSMTDGTLGDAVSGDASVSGEETADRAAEGGDPDTGMPDVSGRLGGDSTG